MPAALPLALTLLLALPTTFTLAAPTADNPDPRFWFRNTEGPGPETGLMDPRLQQVADLFGAGHYSEARRLAQALLDNAEVPDLRPQAAAFLIESHLAEADFDAARGAAQRLAPVAPSVCQDALARIGPIETAYKADLSRLQHLLARAERPAEAARVQLLIAHTHRAVGAAHKAYQSYWDLLLQHPDSPEALVAARAMVALQWQLAGPDEAGRFCEVVVGLGPDRETAACACEELLHLALPSDPDAQANARHALSRIAATHPATRASDIARHSVGELYSRGGEVELAEKQWADLLADRPESQVAADTRAGLADLRYSVGMDAFAARDYAGAAHWLGRLLPDIHLIRLRDSAGNLLPSSDPSLPAKRRHAIFCLGESCEKLERWHQAATAFEKLTLPGSPAEKVALFKVITSYAKAGSHAEALDAFNRLKDRFPESAYIARCEDYILTVKGEP